MGKFHHLLPQQPPSPAQTFSTNYLALKGNIAGLLIDKQDHIPNDFPHRKRVYNKPFLRQRQNKSFLFRILNCRWRTLQLLTWRFSQLDFMNNVQNEGGGGNFHILFRFRYNCLRRSTPTPSSPKWRKGTQSHLRNKLLG